MNDDGAPNAHSADGSYFAAGGALKIRYLVERNDRGWLEFSPANLKVEFNGAPVDFCQGIELKIGAAGVPECKMSFSLTDVDIDMDTLIWLQAHIASKEVADA